MEAGSKGSAWNKSGSTWEEKPVNAWAYETLTESFGQLAFDAPTAKLPKPPEDYGGGEVQVSCKCEKVVSIKGDVTYVVSRGKQRVVLELTFTIRFELEVRVDGELKQIVPGKLTATELANDDLDDDTMPDCIKVQCDSSAAKWKSFFEKAVTHGGWKPVKAAINGLIDGAKQRFAP